MASAYYRVSTDDDEEEEVIDLTEAIVQPPPRKRQKRAPAEAIDLTCDDDDINIMSVVTVVDLSEEDDIIAVQQQVTTNRGGGAAAAAAAAAADCVICMDPLTLASTKPLSCHHQFHTACMKRHILTSIEQMRTPIPCPLCPQASAAGLRDTEVKQFLTKAEIKKYSKAVEQQRVMTDPNLRHCPTPDCTHVYNIEKLKIEKGRGNPHCPQCGNELSLSEARDKGGDKGEAELQHYVSRNGVRKCRRCSAWVEKHSGCSKMRCICGYKFCYDCGKENATCACTSPNHAFLSTKAVRQGNHIYGEGGGLPDHHVLQVFAAGQGAGGRGRSGGGARAAIAELAGIGGGAAFQQALGRLFGLAER